MTIGLLDLFFKLQVNQATVFILRSALGACCLLSNQII